ncbi:MAG TPA: DUF3261 domain-containing protein, partial [Chitinolyticbacter sp.]|nr:DUF3261 domain-containing protein [Chitinolyticbacter sp.]
MRALIVAVLLLAACATPPAERVLPPLRLAPADYGASVSLVQRLTVWLNPDGQGEKAAAHSLDAQLEIDAEAVQLVGIALGQRVLKLRWDGRELASSRHALLPQAVDAAHVLRDVQLVFWPAESIRAALPAGWTLRDTGANERTLLHAGQELVRIRYEGAT